MSAVMERDFDKENRETLYKFLKGAEKNQDDLSGTIIATMSQFILNLRLTLTQIAKGRDWVTPIEIIDSQVKELRRCIVDLETYKERLKQGVTHQ